jgi:hypothetical protein
LLLQQALPLKHPIRAYVAEDRQARTQGHKRLHAQRLQAEGALPRLPLAMSSAAVSAAEQQATKQDGRSSTGRLQDDGCAGGSNPAQLLFCSKHWLLQVDSQTGGHSDMLNIAAVPREPFF